MSLKSQTRDPQLKKSLPEDLCSGFLRPEKSHRPQTGLNARTLDLEASTLPRDHQGRRVCRLMSGEQTDVVSNSYATYYWVGSSLRKTGKDLCIRLAIHLRKEMAE